MAFFSGPVRVSLLLSISLFSTYGCVSHRTRDIAYVTPKAGSEAPTERNLLDVYAPKKKSSAPLPVVVFIHGGNWNSGSKNTYWFIGRALAARRVVAVVINYRLSPAVMVPAMADDCARAVQWVTAHIGQYGGDPDRVYVMGHSAGGGLAALLATDSTLFIGLGMARNPVKGAILDDPAGINMYDYLLKMEYPGDRQYLVPFGSDPAGWKAMSPLFKVRPGVPPMLLYTGGKTYPSIIAGTEALRQRLQQAGVKNSYYQFPGKKHVPMVTQLFWKNNRIYRDLLALVAP